MKLLLTSNGLSNESISQELFRLANREPKDTVVCIITTATNAETGDKSWFINDLINIHKQGFKEIYMTDIAAVSEALWKPQIEKADILVFEGGNTYYLMEHVRTSGLDLMLPELLKTKVYVGISAGSMITNPDLATLISQAVYEEDFDKPDFVPGLGFVDFYITPHLNSPHFPKLIPANIKAIATRIPKKIYGLDDQSAVSVIDGTVTIITQGQYIECN